MSELTDLDGYREQQREMSEARKQTESWEYQQEGRGEQEHFVVWKDLDHNNRPRAIVDTLNCDSSMSIDDQRQFCEQICIAVNQHDSLLAEVERLRGELTRAQISADLREKLAMQRNEELDRQLDARIASLEAENARLAAQQEKAYERFDEACAETMLLREQNGALEADRRKAALDWLALDTRRHELEGLLAKVLKWDEEAQVFVVRFGEVLSQGTTQEEALDAGASAVNLTIESMADRLKQNAALVEACERAEQLTDVLLADFTIEHMNAVSTDGWLGTKTKQLSEQLKSALAASGRGE